jgi:predicted nucleic acid-binding protein
VLAVDTNVLVYATDVDSQFHTPCSYWLERQRARPDALYTTWGVLYEFLRVTHPSTGHATALERAGGLGFVTALLASPGLAILVPTHRHADIAGEVILELPHLAGNLVNDAHTAILMRVQICRMPCLRTNFHQLAFFGGHRSASILAANNSRPNREARPR